MTDLPQGFRWANENETERHATDPIEGAIMVQRTFDSQGVEYTQGEADLAVSERTSLDVWLKFSTDPEVLAEEERTGEDELAEYEANTYKTEDGFSVEWYHNAVGQVSSKSFDTYEEATAWLTKEGFQDFSS